MLQIFHLALLILITQRSLYNYAQWGGGLYLSTGGTTVTNSILADNTAGNGPSCYGTIYTSNHNIITDITGCTITKGTGDQFNINAKIKSSLTGIPPIHSLLVGSPAFDKGNSGNCPATDETGVARPQEAGCDMGAAELIPPHGIPAEFSILSGNNQKKPINQSYNSLLRVIVKDGFGATVSGASVTFSAPYVGASGTFSSNNSYTETVTTNDLGIATSSVFTANSTVGAFNVTVSVPEIDWVTDFSLENIHTPGIPTTFILSSGDNQKKSITQTYGLPLVVRIMDGNGDPINGVPVVFSAPTSGTNYFFPK
ncbi:MAG: Ig-like domain-containing protein [Anaerolineales bacterium]